MVSRSLSNVTRRFDWLPPPPRDTLANCFQMKTRDNLNRFIKIFVHWKQHYLKLTTLFSAWLIECSEALQCTWNDSTNGIKVYSTNGNVISSNNCKKEGILFLSILFYISEENIWKSYIISQRISYNTLKAFCVYYLWNNRWLLSN